MKALLVPSPFICLHVLVRSNQDFLTAITSFPHPRLNLRFKSYTGQAYHTRPFSRLSGLMVGSGTLREFGVLA